MSRLLAIDWNESELRAVVADVSGGRATIVRADSRTWLKGETDGPVDAATMAGGLRGWIAETGSGKLTTLVALDRSFVELCELTLPPAPIDELPDLVRFQVQREVSNLNEQSPLDYIVLSGSEDEPYHVLAAIVRSDNVERISQVCEAAGLRLSRMVFRPCATAALVHRRSTTPDAIQLIVHPVQSDVDMAVIDGRAIQMIRSVRLPVVADRDAMGDALIREVRRTIISARQQLGDREIESVTVCGSSDCDSALTTRLAAELKRKVTLLETFETGQNLAIQFDSRPEHAGQFAPLVGLVLDEADGTLPVLDFLNPHHRPAERSNKTVLMFAAAAIVLLTVGYGLWQYGRIATADRNIASAQAQLQPLDPLLKTGKSIVDQTDRIGAWVQTDAIWLDELARLSESLRPALLKAKDYPVDLDIIAEHLHMELKPRNGTVQIDLKAVAKTRKGVAPFEKRLRDDGHRVDIVSGTADTSKPGYRWEFKTRVQIETTEAMLGQE